MTATRQPPMSLRDRAVAAARGVAPFDMLITGGTLVDVATGELRRADVGLVGPLVASVHEPASRIDSTSTLDATGRFLAPGLIDGHMHVESSMVTPRAYAETVLPQGTTAIVWDPHEVANVLGLAGVRWAIAASRGLPLDVTVLAPSSVPSAPGLELAGAAFDGPELRTMLGWPEIGGVAEVMDMRGVLERQPRMVAVTAAGLDSGKLLCGHARGLAGADLQGFVAAGIESDHEITLGDDLLSKLRAGMTIELRGSHDYVLPGCVEVLNRLPRVPQTVTLCTDDVFPDDLVAKGGMIDLVRRLVGYGLNPLDAWRCGSLNAAQRLGRRDLGLLAPGRRADIVLLGDLETFPVTHVLAGGELVAEAGAQVLPLRPDPAPPPTGTMHLEPLPPAAFVPHAQARGRCASLRTVKGARFTEWGTLEVAVVEGVAELPPAATLMAVVHRHGRAAPSVRLTVLEDWGQWRGALATTVSHDSHNLTLFGRDPADLAAAANAVIGAGGGMAVAAGGSVQALLPLPVCGLLADRPTTEVAADFRALRAAADAIADWQPPFRVFKAVVGASLACNSGPHLTDRGLTDGTTREVFPTGLGPVSDA